ncbi:hypothetical protein Salat_0888500 [Sesamum alatum]|uniref:Uncharacterized protein n=1 Tax=Sesamum alatum TaxID=300844 RepID=A0AAE1YJ52_9LAMI|nr:hypothetical protein Salat_0888500 [Sesamum alatum]
MNYLPTLSSRATTGNSGGDQSAMEDTPATKEEEERVRSFNLPAFASLTERVVGSNDTQSLQTLERLKAQWAARYGSGGTGTTSTAVGSFVEAQQSPLCTSACGVTSSPRVSQPIHNTPLPAARVLLQKVPSPKGKNTTTLVQ